MNLKLPARLGAAVTVGVLAVALAACSGSPGTSSAPTTSAGTETPGAATNGTVTYLGVSGQWEGADPASIYYGNQLAAFRRLVYRGLTAFPITDDPSPVPQGDLATDAGTTADNGLTWTFTIRDGAKWQDGSPVTGADFVYGLSRSYDDTLVNGTGVGTTFLGQYAPSVVEAGYTGPFTSKPEAQKVFDEHFFADGQTVTYKFDVAWPDFPYAAASLFTTDPYQESFDAGTANLWKINSSGPYILEGGEFDGATGGTFVRNPEYDPASDTTELREALPDSFKFEFVSDSDVLFQRLLADGSDATSFTDGNIPATFYSEITGDIESRTLISTSPYTRFLQINSLTVTDPKVRTALTVALDRDGVVQAWGGDKWGEPTSTFISKSLPGFIDNPAFKDIPAKGDPEAAKALLAEAGQPNPDIVFSFADTPTNQKLAPVIQQSWEAAGFKVSLAPIAQDATPGYYGQMADKEKNGNKVDVFFAGWASDWPALFGVVVPILQSNPEGATSGVGFNYGFYSNAEVDDLIQQAFAASDPAEQTALLQQADAVAGADGAYVPIANQKNYFLFGSKIKGFLPTVAASYYPDFGSIHVEG